MDVDHKNTNSTANDNYSSSATDVSDLQREKAQVELQMLRLKSNINAIEFQLNHNERVSPNHPRFFLSPISHYLLALTWNFRVYCQ